MATYVHDLDPFAIQFSKALEIGPLHLDGIRWYGLAYLAGFLCTYLAIRYMAKQQTTPMKVDEVADFITMGAVGVMAGGRLGYCLFYSPQLLIDFSLTPPFWGVLKVYEGGMSSHGGILGVILVCLWWARSRKVDAFHIFDLVALGGGIGFFFGRIANFINGELWGREAPAGLSWAVKFPQEMYGWTRDNLMKLMEIAPAVNALGSVTNSKGETISLNADLWRSWVQNYRTDVQSWNMVNEVVEKLIVATQTGQMQVIQALEPFLTARYPSQLIQSFLEGFLVFAVLAILWLKPRKPGVIGAGFGIGYAVARIIGEQFRMPDAQIGFQWLGLTRGQWLSILMLAFVVVYTVYILKRSSKPMGGWKAQIKS
ncbi:MAG: prolipoprotein diacylglyceryl transferase [Bdellovibrionales bacterium]